MLFSNHQLVSVAVARWCRGAPAKLCAALPIIAPIFLAKVSCNNLLSLSQSFSLSFCGLFGSVFVKAEFQVLEMF